MPPSGRIVDIHSIARYDPVLNQVFGVIQDITAQKEAERELRASEERFRGIIEGNPVPMAIVTKNQNVISLNHKFTETYGFTLDDIPDIPTLWLKAFPDPGLRKPVTERWKATTGNGPEEDQGLGKLTGNMRCRDHSQKTVELHFVSLGEVNVISVIDISDLTNTQRALRESQEKLRLSVEASGHGIFEIDLSAGKITFSPEVSRMLGYGDGNEFQEAEVSLQGMVIHPDDREKLSKLLSDYAAGLVSEYRDEIRLAGANGGWIWVMWSGRTVRFTPGGKPSRILGILVDITRIKDYESQLLMKNKEIASQNEEYAVLNEELQTTLEELQKTNRILEVEKQRAQESDRLKSAFLANMSHEIRTPMNSILGFSELLAQEDLSREKRLKFTSLIHNSGEQLMRLINDIIDISKIESNQLRIEKEWCRVNELLEEILMYHRQHRHFAEKPGLLLRLDLPADGSDLILYTDGFRLRQILDNLINNAIKFTDEGSIDVGYSIKKEGREKMVEFYIRDTGTGISTENLRKIFIRFMQADNTPRAGGTGLGLSITKGLVELLGGRIRVESTPGKGSVFSFTHPYTGKQNVIRLDGQGGGVSVSTFLPDHLFNFFHHML